MNRGPAILVIRPGALGDTIFVEPVIAALRARYPEARIEIAGRDEFVPLLVGPGLADACSSTDAARFTTLFTDGPARLTGCDIILAFLPDAGGSLAGKLGAIAGAAVVFDPRPPDDGTVHIVDHLLGALEPLGVPPVRTRPQVPRWPEWLAAAAEIDPLVAEEGGYVAIHPGSGGLGPLRGGEPVGVCFQQTLTSRGAFSSARRGGRHKLWPAAEWAAVVDALRPRPVVLTCGPADRTVVDDVLAHVSGDRPLVVTGQPVTTLAGVLAGAAAFVGCDSGVTHLAAALDLPTVALFGPTDSGTWAPRGTNVRVLDGGPRMDKLATADVLAALRA